MNNNFFKRQDFLSLLNKIIHEKELSTQNTNLSFSMDAKSLKHYYLSTTIELVTKFSLLEIDKVYIEQFINELNYLISRKIEYIDYLKQANQLLLNYCLSKLEIEDATLTKSKKEVLEYTYNTFIKNGYYFTSFLNKDHSKVTTSGLYLTNYLPYFDKMEEIEQIYIRRRLPLPFKITVKQMKKDYFEITDSMAVTYFQANSMPEYLNNLTSTYKEMKEGYDSDAYLRKDKNACLNNLEIFLIKNNFNDQEKRLIFEFVELTWNNLLLNSKDVTVALIKRSSLGKDNLIDYQNIIDKVNEKDLVYSFSQIIDGRYIGEKKFSKVMPKNFITLSLPSYYRITNYHHQQIKKPLVPKKKGYQIRHYNMAHGIVNIFALSGLILFLTGIALIFASIFIGG